MYWHHRKIGEQKIDSLMSIIWVFIFIFLKFLLVVLLQYYSIISLLPHCWMVQHAFFISFYNLVAFVITDDPFVVGKQIAVGIMVMMGTFIVGREKGKILGHHLHQVILLVAVLIMLHNSSFSRKLVAHSIIIIVVVVVVGFFFFFLNDVFIYWKIRNSIEEMFCKSPKGSEYKARS